MKYLGAILAFVATPSLAGCGGGAAGFTSAGAGGSTSSAVTAGTGGGYGSGGSTGTGMLQPLEAIDVAVGASHSCAVLTDGTVACWGDGSIGQLGDGNAGKDYHRPTAVRVPGVQGATVIRAGGGTTCVIATGAVLCWGDGSFGQLGDGVAQDGYFQPSPVAPKGLSSPVDISVSPTSVCAALSDGSVRCWGKNSAKMQLGFDSPDCGPYTVLDMNGNAMQVTTPCETTPHIVPGATDAVAVATGGAHACLINHAGDVLCWGADNFGQLGDGLSGPDAITPMPTPVLGLGQVSRLTLGKAHTCASGGSSASPQCWGDNSFGQLGTGSNALPAYQTQPTSVTSLGSTIDIDAAENATCAVLGDLTVRCWGDTTTLLEMPGPMSGTLKPTEPTGVGYALGVRIGGGHACTWRASGSVVCWGLNDRGQAGNGMVGQGDYSLGPVAAP